MQWPPAYKRIVLERGDEEIAHSGGKGGLRIGRAELARGEAQQPEAEAHPGNDVPPAADLPEPEGTPLDDELRPWLKWLRDVGRDS
jgi:hypothetical protein